MSYYGSLEISHISFIFPSHSRIYFPSVNQMKMTKRLIVSFGILFWCFIATVLQITEAPRTITHTHTTQSFLELVCALCVVQVVPVVPPIPSHLNSITPPPTNYAKFSALSYTWLILTLALMILENGGCPQPSWSPCRGTRFIRPR